MGNKKELQKLEKALDIVENEMERKQKELINLLNTVEIENINLLNFHYTFISLINKKEQIEQQIFNLIF